MVKPELGTKRVCAECGSKFYDLGKDPIVCPRCGATFEPAVLAASRARPEPARPKAAPKAPQGDYEEEPEAEEPFVALEEADAEETDTGRAAKNGEAEETEGDIPDIEEEESLGGEKADEFLDEDEDSGVSPFIESDIEEES